jgi:hypothetical protein
MRSDKTDKRDLWALRCLIAEAETILATTELPEGRTRRMLELLEAARELADHLTITKPAATLGKRGGLKTAERGPGYFAKIAAMRKTRAGGRPPRKAATP